MEGNCMTGCRHCVKKELYKRVEYRDDNGKVWGMMNEFNGYQTLCEKNQATLDAWRHRNADKTYEQYKTDCLPCYEPTEVAETLNGMINIANEILDKLNKNK